MKLLKPIPFFKNQKEVEEARKRMKLATKEKLKTYRRGHLESLKFLVGKVLD